MTSDPIDSPEKEDSLKHMAAELTKKVYRERKRLIEEGIPLYNPKAKVLEVPSGESRRLSEGDAGVLYDAERHFIESMVENRMEGTPASVEKLNRAWGGVRGSYRKIFNDYDITDADKDSYLMARNLCDLVVKQMANVISENLDQFPKHAEKVEKIADSTVAVMTGLKQEAQTPQRGRPLFYCNIGLTSTTIDAAQYPIPSDQRKGIYKQHQDFAMALAAQAQGMPEKQVAEVRKELRETYEGVFQHLTGDKHAMTADQYVRNFENYANQAIARQLGNGRPR